MIQYFKNIDGQTIEIQKADQGVWVNLVPPFKEEEFIELSEELEIPIEFLRDSLDIDERPRYEMEDNVKIIIIKTPTENNSFNDSDAFYITKPIPAPLVRKDFPLFPLVLVRTILILFSMSWMPWPILTLKPEPSSQHLPD